MEISRHRRFALYNAKGGTGKTTDAINLAGALHERGHRCLVVDMDPQGNLTEALGHPEVYDREPPNLFDLVTGNENPETSKQIIVEDEEMDLLPSNVDMLNAERELTVLDHEGKPALQYLDRCLAEVEPDYDVVLVDCPPFFGQLTDTVLYASRDLIIPALAEATSQRAVELLLDQAERLSRETDITCRERAVVLNRVEPTKEAEWMKKWFRTAFPDVPLFTIRKRVLLQRLVRRGYSMFRSSRSCDMEDEFIKLAEHILSVSQKNKSPNDGADNSEQESRTPEEVSP
jgi:chromosome partitioning protein